MFKAFTYLLFAASLLLVAVSASESHTELEAWDAWSDQVLSTHNAARARYGSKPLQWSASLYSGTLAHAETCKFGHSDAQGQYGENLFAASNPKTTIEDAMNTWMAESSKYDYNQPEFSPATGEFTQVVWKNTTEVACALSSCPAGSISSVPTKYIVCRYTPPGNVQGQFAKNVGRPIAN